MPAAPHEDDEVTGAREGAAPPVRVHPRRLERRVGPLALSPTEALRLADEGRRGLSRRELPPDGSEDGGEA